MPIPLPTSTEKKTSTSLALKIGVSALVIAAAAAGVLLTEKQKKSSQRQTARITQAPPLTTTKPSANDFVPGEVLVKFKPNIKNGDVIIREVLKDPQSQLVDKATGKIITNEELKRQGQARLNKPFTTRTVDLPVKDVSQFETIKRQAQAASAAKANKTSVKTPVDPIAKGVGLDRWVRVQTNKDADVSDLVERFRGRPKEIELAEPNYIYKPLYLPNDYYYNTDLQTPPVYSWGQSYPDLWGLKRINTGDAWNTTKGSPQVVIAIIDTGTDYNHEDFYPQGVTPNLDQNYAQSNIWVNQGEIGTDGQGRDKRTNGIDDDGNGFVDDWRGWDFYNGNNNPFDGPNDGHGSHTAGTAAAKIDNAVGVAGVCGNCKVMILKVCENMGCNGLAINDAILYATTMGAKVMSMSLGGPSSGSEHDAIINAYNHNVTMAGAAGNDGSNNPTYPGAYEEVLGVAASDSNDAPASFTNWGDWVDVTAPGVGILSLRGTNTDMYCFFGPQYCNVFIIPVCQQPPCEGKYYRANGTSMATPHVGGLLGLVRSAAPSLTAHDVYKVVRLSSQDVFTPRSQRNPSRWGLVNANDAIQMALGVGSNPRAELYVKDAHAGLTAISGSTMTITVTATVENMGFIASGQFAYDIQANSTTYASGNVSSIAPDGTATISATFQGPIDTTYLLRVDIGDVVPEYSETNNSATATPEIPALDNWPIETTNTVFASPSIADLNNDGLRETVIVDGYGYVYPYRPDGTLMAGNWPQFIDNGGGYASPAIANIDNDPSHPGLEMVVASFTGTIHVYHADGTEVPGWPQTPIERISGVQYPYIYGSPAVADIDDDGAAEIVLGIEYYVVAIERDADTVYAWESDGRLVTGWPKTLDNLEFDASAAIADVRPDLPGKEIFLSSCFDKEGSNAADAYLYGWTAAGDPLPGWQPKVLIDRCAGSTMTLADLDPNYPGLEVAVGVKVMATYGGEVYAWHADGTSISGSQWPQPVQYWLNCIVNGSPAISDIDPTTPGLEVAASCVSGQVKVWRANGTPVSGWENGKSAGDYLNNISPALADIDGDGALEILIGPSMSGVFNAWHWDGQPVAGFPTHTRPATWWGSSSSPAVADVNGDGQQEIFVGWDDSMAYAWTYPAASTAITEPWPTFHHDIARTGFLDAQIAPQPFASVVITSPSPDATLSGTVTLQARATANLVDTVAVDFYRDGGNTLIGASTEVTCGSVQLQKGASAQSVTKCYQLVWNTTTVDDGPQTLKARVTTTVGGSAGPTAWSSPVNVTIDNIPFIVTLTSPLDGATVRGTVQLSANVSSPAFFVLFYLDGNPIAYAQQEPFTSTWDTRTAANGSRHTLRAYAYSTSGEEATSSTITVTVDNSASKPPPPPDEFSP